MGKVMAGEQVTIVFSLNGESVSGMAQPRLLLSDYLRGQLGVTGSHVGCEHGICGACTVKIDGRAVRSCLTLAVQADGKCVETVEGLAKDGVLSPLQEAFRRHHALQCGFCTPGILMSLSELVESEMAIDEEGVRDLLSGHLCRCTGYENIVRAALDVFKGVKTGDPDKSV